MKPQVNDQKNSHKVGKLECNSAGQWGWLADECGLPIAETIAEELTRGRP